MKKEFWCVKFSDFSGSGRMVRVYSDMADSKPRKSKKQNSDATIIRWWFRTEPEALKFADKIMSKNLEWVSLAGV